MKKAMFRRNRLWVACSQAILMASLQQTAQANDSNEELIEEVVVTATYSNSLKKALDRKRESQNVMDSIIAEDIGKMPDENVAEALQRVTGISINRNDGEGTTVSVRGMSAGLNRVTLNGSTLTSAGEERGFSFENLSADLLSAIEVIKTPSADHDEGSVGGSINLKTVRPLNLKKPRRNAEVQSRYNEYSQDTDISGSASFADKFFDERLGVAATVSYENRSFRTDTAQTFGWTKGEATTVDGDTIEGSMINGLVPRLELKDRERLGATVGFQYQPDDVTDLHLDLAYSKLETEAQLNQVIIRFRKPINGTFVHDGGGDDGIFTSGEFSKGNSQLLFREWADKTENYVINFGGDREMGDWTASADFGYSMAEKSNPYRTTTRFVRNQATAYDLQGQPKNPSFTSTTLLTDPSNIKLAELSLADVDLTDTEKVAQFDLERVLDWNGINAVKFGIKYRDRNKKNIPKIFKYRPRGALQPALADHLGEMLVDDFMDGVSGGAGASEWVSVDFDSVVDLARERGGLSDTLDEEELKRFKINEESQAAYGKISFAYLDDRLRGDFGVRYVTTTTTSSGAQNRDSGIIDVEFDHSYNNTLPSLNLRYAINEDMLLRFGAGRVMARPSFGHVKPVLRFDKLSGRGNGGNPHLDPFVADQIDLSWEWYFDEGAMVAAGLFHKDVNEFIFRRRVIMQIPDGQGGFVRNQADNNFDFDIAAADNADGGRISGIELSYQQNFDFLPGIFSDFGTVLNYTYANSSATFLSVDTGVEKKMPFPEQSEHTMNATLFWEKNGHSVRLAYNYRTDYLVQPFSGANTKWADEYGQLDASASFKIADGVSLSIQAINLTNEIPYQYLTFFDEGNALKKNISEDRLSSYKQTGRQLRVGIRATF